MMKMKSLNVGRLFLLLVALFLSSHKVMADISDVNGIAFRCITNGVLVVSSELGYSFTIGCTLHSDAYVPSGNYVVETKLLYATNSHEYASMSTTAGYIDGSKKISEQTITGLVATAKTATSPPVSTKACQYLHNIDTGKLYAVSPEGTCTAVAPPMPPTPPSPPDTSCTLNDGNALNVNLNNVDRSQIPTVPGSGSMRHIQVPVECTGGDVTVNMQLNYTPISLSAGQVIKSSSNGLGVSVVYNGKILSSTDITPVTFTAGSNSMDLAFQAVRDPTVEIKDVPTGAFTASAVLVMTQQ